MHSDSITQYPPARLFSTQNISRTHIDKCRASRARGLFGVFYLRYRHCGLV
jgi:hypothetical protein